jgi:hypothetical protein
MWETRVSFLRWFTLSAHLRNVAVLTAKCIFLNLFSQLLTEDSIFLSEIMLILQKIKLNIIHYLLNPFLALDINVHESAEILTYSFTCWSKSPFFTNTPRPPCSKEGCLRGAICTGPLYGVYHRMGCRTGK